MKRLLMCISLILGLSAFAFGGDGIILGQGTSASPYLIEDLDDFIVFADPANAGVYCDENIHLKLLDDIDFNGLPVFNSGVVNPGGSFKGFFDGNNKTLSNISIALEEEFNFNCGVFPNVNCGVVIDLTISNVYISSLTSDSTPGTGIYIGGLAGKISSIARVENCHVSGEIACMTDKFKPFIGGLAGAVDLGSAVRYSSANITIVSNTNGCGGLVGYCTGTVNNCHTSGSISAESVVGGIAGSVNGGNLLQCSSNCSVISTGDGFDDVGGLAGKINSGIVEKCFALGNVNASSHLAMIGGLIGSVNNAKVINCYSSGIVDDHSNYAGAFIGKVVFDINLVSNCFWNIDNNQGLPWSSSDDGLPAGAVGLTSQQMKEADLFVSSGWKFAGNTVGLAPAVWYLPPDFAGLFI